MDPITVTHLVQDRTDELQRTADQLRRERALRPTRTVAAVASTAPRGAAPASPALRPERRPDARPMPATTDGCTPARPAA